MQNNQAIIQAFLEGRFINTQYEKELETEEWNPHPSFKGIYLKHLIRGKENNGMLSCHLVRIEQNCCIKMHQHPDNWELHEVLFGKGICTLDNKEINYHPGILSITPAGIEHQVFAEKEIIMFAKFFPALV